MTLLSNSVVLLGLHQPVEDLDELLTEQTSPSGGVQCGLQPVFHLAQQLLPHERRVQRQDVGALAGHRGDEALGGQLGVGAGGSDDADPQVTREGTDRRQSGALGELTGQDGRAHLLFDLLIERHASAVGQHHTHGSPPDRPFLRLYIGTIYGRDGSNARGSHRPRLSYRTQAAPRRSASTVRDGFAALFNRVIEEILPAQVTSAESFADTSAALLFPEEMALVTGAVEKRQREFATARECARTALAELGVPPVPILRGERGYKAWFPLTSRWLGFEDAVVAVNEAEATFDVRLLPGGIGHARSIAFRGPDVRDLVAAGGYHELVRFSVEGESDVAGPDANDDISSH